MLTLFAAMLTIVSWHVRPDWDDGGTWLLERWPDATPADSHPERTVLAAVAVALSRSGVLWEFSAAAHFLAWLGAGVLTYLLWLRIGGLRIYALSAGMLAMAPVVCQTQFVLFNPIFTALVGIVFVWVAILLTWPVEAEQRLAILRYGIAAVLVASGVLLSEYALASALAGAVVLTCARRGWASVWSPREWAPAAWLLTIAAAAYCVYSSLGDLSARQSVSPEFFLAGDQTWRLKVLLPRTVTLVWQGCFGRVLEHLAQLQIGTARGLLALFVGIGTGGLLMACTRLERVRDESEPHWQVPIGCLLAAAFVALLPVSLMGRVVLPDDRFSTKVFLPILPLAACVAVYALGRLSCRSLRWLVPMAIGLLAGYWLTYQSCRAIHERELVAQWGRQLEPLIDTDGMTVAVFDIAPGVLTQPLRDHSLTARLSFDWPADKHGHFYAFSSYDQATRFDWLQGVNWDRSAQRPAFGDKGYLLSGSIDRVWWVHVDRDGRLDIREANAEPMPAVIGAPNFADEP